MGIAIHIFCKNNGSCHYDGYIDEELGLVYFVAPRGLIYPKWKDLLAIFESYPILLDESGAV